MRPASSAHLHPGIALTESKEALSGGGPVQASPVFSYSSTRHREHELVSWTLQRHCRACHSRKGPQPSEELAVPCHWQFGRMQALKHTLIWPASTFLLRLARPLPSKVPSSEGQGTSTKREPPATAMRHEAHQAPTVLTYPSGHADKRVPRAYECERHVGKCGFPRRGYGDSAGQAVTPAVQMSGTVLLNELRGHRQIYDAIKGMPGGKECAVGIVHNVFWLEPKGDGLAYSHVKCAAPPSKPPPPRPAPLLKLLLAALCGPVCAFP